ncbi:MAG: insulinase family protein [Flavobacteriia bacterium]|nr:insulinase family protein [Flavobacteriia bacterium]
MKIVQERFHRASLPNGLRILHQQTRGPICHLAIIIRAGSRDEQEREQGLAHFVEHCLFKGTAHRKTYHILSRLDDIGGELNAFTGKEDTTLYATVLDPYFRRAAELLVDIAFHSTFPEREIGKEKEVVVDEIQAYADSPSDHIFDLFDELIFSDHPLGRNILGTPKSVRSFSRNHLLEFTARLYRTDRIVLATAGPLSGEKVERVWSTLFDDILPERSTLERKGAGAHKAVHAQKETAQSQTHCILGNRAFGGDGPTMNNRLNLRIRERFGLTYHLESFYTPYTDVGCWGVYFSTEPGHSERVVRLVHKELKELRERALGTLQLSRAKKQVQGQIALAQENAGSSVGSAARSLLHRGSIEPLEQIMERIDRISATELLEVANQVFEPTALSSIYLRGQGST